MAVLTVLSGPASAQPPQSGGGGAQPQVYLPNAAQIAYLFGLPLPQIPNPAKHTFVFWVNGAQDHFEPVSSVPTGTRDANPRLYRADKIEVGHILNIANSCPNCNIVILHAQRGGAKWYTAKKPFAAYLRVYSRGRFYLQRHVDEVDETDPRLLSWLLYFSQGIFPNSDLHLIYRGHSFKAPYTPGSREILPFDYNHPGNSYGEDDFLTSLRFASLVKPLASVTFAACSMASLELASKIGRYTSYFAASEVDVLEVLNVGFRFDSLMQVTDAMTDREVSWLVAWRLLEAFNTVPTLKDAMMEYPMTWTDLTGFGAVAAQFNVLAAELESLPQDKRDALYAVLKTQAELTKGVSQRFVDSLRRAGKTEAAIDLVISQLRVPSENRHDLELGQALSLIASREEAEGMHELASSLADQLRTHVTIINRDPDPNAGTSQIGLSVDFQDAPKPLFPRI